MNDLGTPFSADAFGAEIVRTACATYRTAPMAVLLDLAEDTLTLIGDQVSPETHQELTGLIYDARHDRSVRAHRERLIVDAVCLGLHSPCADEPGGETSEADPSDVSGPPDGLGGR